MPLKGCPGFHSKFKHWPRSFSAPHWCHHEWKEHYSWASATHSECSPFSLQFGHLHIWSHLKFIPISDILNFPYRFAQWNPDAAVCSQAVVQDFRARDSSCFSPFRPQMVPSWSVWNNAFPSCRWWGFYIGDLLLVFVFTRSAFSYFDFLSFFSLHA